jgi:hypothetical protein
MVHRCQCSFFGKARDLIARKRSMTTDGRGSMADVGRPPPLMGSNGHY